MEQNRIRLMEKLDRSFTEHLRRATESDRSAYPAELIAVYEYLKGARLRDCEVCTLLRYPDPLETALVCWRRNVNGNVFDLRFFLAKIPICTRGIEMPVFSGIAL